MRRRHAHLIDPELGWLVGMYVVNRGREADDLVVTQRHDEVMPRIIEEFGGPRRVDSAIEDIRRDMIQQRLIARLQQANLDGHHSTFVLP